MLQSFASPWMLLWGVAAAIPIAIHLWSRRQQHEMHWAAMQFLLTVMQRRSRRLRIERWLLLAVRIAALVVLALALADPFLTGLPAWPTSKSTDRTHTVLVLDASLSMAARSGPSTCFELARQRALDLVLGSSLGNGFTVVLMSAPPTVVIGEAVFDRADLASEIENLEVEHTIGGLISTLSEIERTLDRVARRYPRLTRHNVVFLTDLGQATWAEVESKGAVQKLTDLAAKSDLAVVPVGHAGAQNLATTRLRMSEPWPRVGEPVSLEVRVRNYGSETLVGRLELLVDGRGIGQEELEVAAGREETRTFAHRFVSSGHHVIEARVGGDDLAVDDHRWLSLTIPPALRVLCVEGQGGAAEFVALALAPGGRLPSRVEPKVIGESSLLEVNLREFHCVVLCNVGRFRSEEVSMLAQYVRDGGGLVTLLGNRVDHEHYNTISGAPESDSRWLSASLVGTAQPEVVHFDPLDYRHPIVEPFRGHERAGLLTAPVWRYVQLTPSGEGVEIAMNFTDGSPALLTSSVGRGRTVLLATSASPMSVDDASGQPVPWSALPIWPCFPPLIREMVDYAAAGQQGRHNVVVGDLLSGTLPTGSTNRRLMLEGPRGGSHPVPVTFDAGPPRWAFADTSLSGIYQVVSDRPDQSFQSYAVNVDNRESDLARIDVASLPSQFVPLKQGATGSLVNREGPSRSPLFRLFLASLLILLVSESTLAKWFGERRG
jgi:hypothetical protein